MLELKFFNQWSQSSGIKELRSWSYFVIEESSRAGAVAYLCLLQSPAFKYNGLLSLTQ